MKYSKSVLVFPLFELFILNFFIGMFTQGVMEDHEGFWLYLYLIHILTPSILGFLGSITGIAFLNSKITTKSAINKKHCSLIFRSSVIFSVTFTITWLIIVVPHLINLLTRELLVGILLSILFLVMIIVITIFVIPGLFVKIWRDGGLLLVFFQRRYAAIILSMIIIFGFITGYKM